MARVGIALLAAGSSERLGSPKQLVQFEDKSLLRRAAETALESCCSPMVVVLGANQEACVAELAGLEIQIASNSDWQSGMGSSVRSGLEALLAADELAAVVFMVCDQLLVTPQILDSLVNTFEAGDHPIVASEYEGEVGVPALFALSLFPELLALKGPEGARKVIQRHRDESAIVPFPGGMVDIDTPEDLAKIVGLFARNSRQDEQDE